MTPVLAVPVTDFDQTAERQQQRRFPGWATDEEAKRRVLDRIRWMSAELDRKWK